MRKILHLDCVGGISGDMFVSALSGLPVASDELADILGGLPIEDWSYGFSNRMELGIQARILDLAFASKKGDYTHPAAIRDVIEDADLPGEIRIDALAMLDRLAEAEGKVHGVAPDKVHFHELAGLDLIFDLVAASACVHLLNPDEISCSPLPMGQGTVKIDHGVMPLPAPAVLEILQDIPIHATDIQGETVTPTGAAIVAHFVKEFNTFGTGRITASAQGAGRRKNTDIPNILRAILLAADHRLAESLLLIETNIDDMNPEHYDWVFEHLLEHSALDVWLTPVLMKKGRPAQVLSVLAKADSKAGLLDILYRETSTIGVRCLEIERDSLPRRLEERETEFGPVKGKLIERPDGTEWLPEYDELKRLARSSGLPVRVLAERMPKK